MLCSLYMLHDDRYCYTSFSIDNYLALPGSQMVFTILDYSSIPLDLPDPYPGCIQTLQLLSPLGTERGYQSRLIILHYITLYYIILHYIILYYIISYYIISHIIPHHTISYHITSYHIIPFHVISYHIISYHILFYSVVLYYIIL